VKQVRLLGAFYFPWLSIVVAVCNNLITHSRCLNAHRAAQI
jgi:hypothetical protein